jgi:hypothetical protein
MNWLLLRFTPTEDDVITDGPINRPASTVFVLVHGTYATNSAWVQTGSSLRSYLQKRFGPNVTFQKFSWTGVNSFRGRKNAAIELRQLLLVLTTQNPTPDFFIIAHSHGGNVAMMATGDDARKRCARTRSRSR